MAKPQFNVELFRTKRKENAEREFSEVPKDTYIAVLRKASLTHTKEKGKLMAALGYQIDESGNPFNNQYVWANTILTDDAGNPQEKGYNALAVQLSILKVPQRDDNNIELELESAVGTKVKLDWNPEDENGYSKLRVKKLISRPDGTEAVSGYKDNGQADEIDAESESNAVQAVPGMILILTTGERYVLIQPIEASETADGSEQLMCHLEGTPPTDIKIIDKQFIASFEMPPTKVTEERPSTTPPVTPTPAVSAPPSETKAPTADELDNNELVEEGDELLEEEPDEAPSLEIKADNPNLIGKRASGTSAKSGKGVVGVITENKTPADGMICLQVDKMVYRCKPETIALVA